MLITADYIWQKGHLLKDMDVKIDAQQIVSVQPAGSAKPDLRAHVLMPACTDLQVNGGGGVMLNDDPSPDAMRKMARAHRKLGTGAIMPTVITDSPEIMKAAAEAALDVRGEAGLLGLHIEGPHINPIKRGTHAEKFIRPLDDHTLGIIQRLRKGDVPVIITLAPEMVSSDQIALLASWGAIVSAGHSNASLSEGQKMLTDGVTMCTHLFNAMPPLLHREPGLVAAAILSDAYCGIIADGIHVSWEALKIAMAARPQPDRMFLVSDAMATVGGPDHFHLYGQTIRVQDGALINNEGSLAGAHTTMVEGLAGLVWHADVPLAQAISMTTDIPRAAIGLPAEPGIVPGAYLESLIALDDTLTLKDVAP